ncbi:hypothetical protein TNCV_2550601 [Trichonephila clavipes]|nr:hypothetical protein TNCV_2550601 [Trichonephila clavipes]
MTSTLESKSVEAQGGGSYFNSQSPAIKGRSDSQHLYSPLQSVCDEEFMYSAGIAVMTFSPNSCSERVKRHHVLPKKLFLVSNHINSEDVQNLPTGVVRRSREGIPAQRERYPPHYCTAALNAEVHLQQPSYCFIVLCKLKSNPIKIDI